MIEGGAVTYSLTGGILVESWRSAQDGAREARVISIEAANLTLMTCSMIIILLTTEYLALVHIFYKAELTTRFSCAFFYLLNLPVVERKVITEGKPLRNEFASGEATKEVGHPLLIPSSPVCFRR